MSKEQFEEIEQLLSDYYEDIDDPFATTDNALAIVERVGSIIDFAKEQAERVQELKEQLKDRDSAISTGIHVSNLMKKQNKRLRETLEFYANPSNYVTGTSIPNVNVDGGRKAIKTLEGESE